MRDAGEIARKLVATIMRDDEATNDEVADRIAAAIREARAEERQEIDDAATELWRLEHEKSNDPSLSVYLQNTARDRMYAIADVVEIIRRRSRQANIEARGEAGR